MAKVGAGGKGKEVEEEEEEEGEDVAVGSVKGRGCPVGSLACVAIGGEAIVAVTRVCLGFIARGGRDALKVAFCGKTLGEDFAFAVVVAVVVDSGASF